MSALSAVPLGDSIASEGKGEYMYVEGRVLSTTGEAVAGASIENFETDWKEVRVGHTETDDGNWTFERIEYVE